jgi:hypothetical protein
MSSNIEFFAVKTEGSDSIVNSIHTKTKQTRKELGAWRRKGEK